MPNPLNIANNIIFHYFKLFYFPNLIGLVKIIVWFAMLTERFNTNANIVTHIYIYILLFIYCIHVHTITNIYIYIYIYKYYSFTVFMYIKLQSNPCHCNKSNYFFFFFVCNSGVMWLKGKLDSLLPMKWYVDVQSFPLSLVFPFIYICAIWNLT